MKWTPPQTLPPLPTAAEERTAAVEYMQQIGDRLAAEKMARGEHVRGLVELRPANPADFQALLRALLTEWRAAWDATPPEGRAVESAAAYAAQIAAAHVERYTPAQLDKLHEHMGFPAAWSRPHAIASLVAFLVGTGFGGWVREQQAANGGRK